MNEYRAALQEVIMAGEACTKDDDIYNAVRYNRAMSAAKALLARPEPQDDLLSAIHDGIGQAILKADSAPGSISLPQNMSEHIAAAVREHCRIESQPEPRITREERPSYERLMQYIRTILDGSNSDGLYNGRCPLELYSEMFSELESPPAASDGEKS